MNNNQNITATNDEGKTLPELIAEWLFELVVTEVAKKQTEKELNQ